MDYKLIIGFLLFTAAQTVAWYQLNSQFVWDYWKDKALLSSLVFAVPVSLMFWYGTRFVYDASEALWTCRFLAFSSGMIIFPILTWMHLNESPFSIKTMLCLVLACMIITIQVLMK